MVFLFFGIGFVVSLVLLLVIFYRTSVRNEITIGDCIASVLFSLGTWITVIIVASVYIVSIIDFDKVVYKKKKKIE